MDFTLSWRTTCKSQTLYYSCGYCMVEYLHGYSEDTLHLLWQELRSYCAGSAIFNLNPSSSSSSSSSIGCGAGDHKVPPCTTIISKCDNLLFLHCSFIIPKQSLYIIKVWSTLSTRSDWSKNSTLYCASDTVHVVSSEVLQHHLLGASSLNQKYDMAWQ